MAAQQPGNAGAVARHAPAWESATGDRAAAIAAVKQAAAGRAVLLAECAGLALGYGERPVPAAPCPECREARLVASDPPWLWAWWERQSPARFGACRMNRSPARPAVLLRLIRA